ncbi:glycine--tRNA ligase 2 [Pyrus ussuriensis x Pyrus communis]|uniref:glycine--tRNA ligase n=1 Tax=Pyrus ussuriensis x Pyrus communis TaxID=2448454 RepID=A0A5N5EX55_9ROSA|nr:glycine--tRNA ligase 2 [Pyrus ussuriensis x Pyrus communis]
MAHLWYVRVNAAGGKPQIGAGFEGQWRSAKVVSDLVTGEVADKPKWPHASRLRLLRPGNPNNPTCLYNPLCHRHCRRFTKTTVSAVSTSAVPQHDSSTNPNDEPWKASVLTFQQAIQRLQFSLFSPKSFPFHSEYWASVGCAIMQCSNTEVGAGTMNPLTFLRVLGPEPWNVAYEEPSIRPDDSRYGENPNRLQRHTQFQSEQDIFLSSPLELRELKLHCDRFHANLLYFAGSISKSPLLDNFKFCSIGKVVGVLNREYSENFLANFAGSDDLEIQNKTLLCLVYDILSSCHYVEITSLARQCAQLWLKTRESLGYPLGAISETVSLVCPQELVEAAVKKVHDDSRLFVLEIGTEEMPPQDVVDASQQLKDLTAQLLAKQRLSHGEIQAFGTPRRLVVSVENLCTKQIENEVEVRGPPVSKAYDDQGNPTKAAEGFCRRYSAPLNLLYRKSDGKTEYVYARVTESARLAVEVLSEDFPNVIARLSFPKSMRWNSQVMFSRPIRWILALHGDVVVPFTFAEVLSGNLSHGLRNTPASTVMVDSAESYACVMRKAGINIEIEERKKTVLEGSNALARSVNGRVFIQEGLLNEVVNLVEAPVPVLGEFKRSFLELPSDLLTMVMQKHQKYFAVKDENGRLLPYFIAVANGAIDEIVVKKGNEAVLRARYEDAKFFYEMDTRKRFSEFRIQLKGILFHEKLGTMLDKVLRIQNTVNKLSLALGMDENTNKVAQDAASLAMADLATAVVTEFTSLSGVMARHYALRDGYSEQVAEALFEITLPRFSGDTLPKTDAGIVLSVADRLDSLVGLFAAGCQPSSANDAFGLRRISYGLVQVLVEKDKHLDLQQALELAADVQPIEVDASTINDAHQFVTRRLEQYLVDKGISSEVVRSVLAERANSPCLAARSACKMEALSKGELFQKVVEAYSRPTRIVRGKDVDPHIEVDEAAFETDEEKALWNSFLSVQNKICHGIEVDEFVAVSSQLLQPLEDFFNHVFVMVEEERIRKNRLALLKKVSDLPRGVADLSILPGF